jgi:transcriptional regulator with XRE-family HTH domain
MTRPPRPRTEIQRTADRQARRVLLDLAAEIATMREDAGLSRREVARAAGISATTQADIEAGRCVPTFQVVSRIGSVLGASFSARFLPGTGPLIRDRLQSAMLQALTSALDGRWRKRLEVPVYRPVRGVIDLVLEPLDAEFGVAAEAHSELRRLEQQVRWATAKADSLAALLAEQRGAGDARHIAVFRLLLLRSTPRTRSVVAEYGELLAIAYPARHADLLTALRGPAGWPGSGILWCDVSGTSARLLERPPRGITLGR